MVVRALAIVRQRPTAIAGVRRQLIGPWIGPPCLRDTSIVLANDAIAIESAPDVDSTDASDPNGAGLAMNGPSRRLRTARSPFFFSSPSQPWPRRPTTPHRHRPVDPATVQRYGPAYRYPQAGWIVLHIEGEPYERGYQHGRLLAPEIADYVDDPGRPSAATSAPADAWHAGRARWSTPCSSAATTRNTSRR